MKIYNTLTKKIEEFKPNKDGEVNIYTCGPTVYHFAHIGNLRTYIFEDILVKTFEYIGYKVNRVMNITDVGHMTSDGDTGEDKMLKGAKREHKTVYEVAKYYTDAFLNDMKSLNIEIPKVLVPASQNIDMYIKIIEKLLNNGYAYQENGNIYFDVSKVSNYYDLSGKNSEELIIGARDDVTEDIHKRNPFDFGLWFTTSKFENQAMKWDSPWGLGYPGWHIECSGISIKYLGEYLDIHCGAEDAVFPHHTNEIAQSEAYLDHRWCDTWVHFGFLNDKTGKMSKSKGDFLTVSLLEEKGYDPLSYRFLCLNSYYHNQLTFSYEILDGAQQAYFKLKNKVRALEKSGTLDNTVFEKYNSLFKAEIENDLNTSNMLTIVYDVLKDSTNSYTKYRLIHDFDKVLSLSLFDDDELVIDSELDAYIKEQIEIRNKAKREKNFSLADQIRDELMKKNIKLIDSREGTKYEIM